MKINMDRRKIMLICIAVSLIIGLWYWNSYQDMTDPLENYVGGEMQEWHAMLNSSTNVILLYTTVFGRSQWSDLSGNKLHTYFKDIGCKQQNCLVTYDRRRLQRANAVLFHGRDIENHKGDRYNPELLKSLRSKVPNKQEWIFFSHENPKYAPSFYSPYDRLFNWTASFRARSRIFFRYGNYIKIDHAVEMEKNYAEGKTGIVAWAVSHCSLMRQEYAMELQYYVNLTVYGKCRHYFNNQRSCKHTSEACKKEISKYKFFLAFENDFCEDYVTEKYWERIVQESVPIVMGANYDKRVVIPDSYIDASQFDSIKELAEYLLYLDSNDTAYNQYFAWKTHYAISSDAFFNLYCQICMALHSKETEPSQIVLSEFFSYENTCKRPNKKKVEKFKKQIADSRKYRENAFSSIHRHFHNVVAKIKGILD